MRFPPGSPKSPAFRASDPTLSPPSLPFVSPLAYRLASEHERKTGVSVGRSSIPWRLPSHRPLRARDPRGCSLQGDLRFSFFVLFPPLHKRPGPPLREEEGGPSEKRDATYDSRSSDRTPGFDPQASFFGKESAFVYALEPFRLNPKVSLSDPRRLHPSRHVLKMCSQS